MGISLPNLLYRFANLLYFLGAREYPFRIYDYITEKGWEGIDTFFTLYDDTSRADASDIRS